MPTSPARTREILADLIRLCMSDCTMPHADRLAHWQAVAAVRAADDHRRSRSPQMRLGEL